MKTRFLLVQKLTKKSHPTQRDSPQLYSTYVLSSQPTRSTRFGPTPRASVQLHAFRSNSTLWRATPRSGAQLHAHSANSTLFLSSPPYGSLVLTSLLRSPMEARGDVDTARQMGRLEAIRPRWDRDGRGSGMGFRDRSTQRTQIPYPSISGAELRQDGPIHGWAAMLLGHVNVAKTGISRAVLGPRKT